jgi:hypothetical protein
MSTSTIKMTTTQTITLTESDGVMALSVQADTTGGSFSFLGSQSFQGIPSEALTLSDGEGVNLVANNPTSPITDVVITWLGGIVNVLISYE